MLGAFILGSIVAGLIVFLRMDQAIMKSQKEIREKIEFIQKQKEEIDKEIAEAIGDFRLMEYERRRMTDFDLMQIDPSDILTKSRTRLMRLKRLRGLSDKD
jgi:hypothetical protein